MTAPVQMMRIPFAVWVNANPIPAENRLARLAEQQLEMLQSDATKCIREFHPSADIFVRGMFEKQGLTLPVVELDVPGFAHLFARDNLDDLAVTVEALRPLRQLDTLGLDFSQLDDTLFDGFLESGLHVYGGYVPGLSYFSFRYRGVPDNFPEVVQRVLKGIE